MGKTALRKSEDDQLDQSLADRGLRSTRQRHHIYSVLLEKRDHPTVEEVYTRAKQGMSDISLATVYNCLDALVGCGLVREVNLDRAPTRYCPNMHEHCHFYCDSCEHVLDIDLPENSSVSGLQIPKGYKTTRYEVSIRGICPECAEKKKSL
jgi:Fur family peroxide stress response transcriptional regulator